MAQITAKMVAELRAKTGCGMMDCKKALVETDGDFDGAVKVLRERGLAVAAKKADRIAAEGLVAIKFNDANDKAAMIEVNSETDFVAKNADFQAFVDGLLDTILACDPADNDALMACAYAGGAEALAESPSAFERWCDNKIIQTIKPQKYNPFSVEPLVAYVLARENEIKTVRIILSAKANNLPEDSIRERVREMYV